MIANEMFHRFNLYFEGGKLFNRTFNEREGSDFLSKAELQITLKRVAAWKNRSGMGFGANNIRMDELSGLISGTGTISRDLFIQGTPMNGALPTPRRIFGNGTTNGSVALNTVDNINSVLMANPEVAPSNNNLGYNYGVFVPIPNECVYILLEYCTVVPIGSAIGAAAQNYIFNVPVKRISQMEYQAGINDKYAQPYANLVWAMDWGGYTVPTMTLNGTTGVLTVGDSVKGMSGFQPYDVATDTTNDLVVTAQDRSIYLIPGDGYEVLDYHIQYIKLPAGITVNLLNPSAAVNSQLASFLHEEIIQEAVSLASASIIPEPNKYQVNENEVKDNE